MPLDKPVTWPISLFLKEVPNFGAAFFWLRHRRCVRTVLPQARGRCSVGNEELKLALSKSFDKSAS
jgi:hypothetical protein